MEKLENAGDQHFRILCSTHFSSFKAKSNYLFIRMVELSLDAFINNMFLYLYV